MPTDYEKLMNLFYTLSWSKRLIRLIAILLSFILSIILNSILGLALGLLIGWLFEGWISAVLASFGIHNSNGEIYKLAALFGLATGFVATFFKLAIIIQTKEDNSSHSR